MFWLVEKAIAGRRRRGDCRARSVRGSAERQDVQPARPRQSSKASAPTCKMRPLDDLAVWQPMMQRPLWMQKTTGGCWAPVSASWSSRLTGANQLLVPGCAACTCYDLFSSYSSHRRSRSRSKSTSARRIAASITNSLQNWYSSSPIRRPGTEKASRCSSVKWVKWGTSM